jgi:surfeit locus 1 family protein
MLETPADDRHEPNLGAKSAEWLLRMPVTLRRFLVPTLAALLLVPAFCAAGFWQLDRAREKRALQAEYDRRAAQPPIVLGAERRSADALQFSRVQATGVYETDYQLLWDNRIHHGIAGYHVITPFHIAGGDTRVLVNRGWVPMGASRADLPAANPPRGTVTITGVAVVPRPEFTLGTLDALKRSRVTVWQQLDLARYAREVDWPMEPVVVLLDPQGPGGFVREWARLDVGAAVHQGYAFQWFMLAAVVVGVYAVLLVRELRRTSPRSSAT